MSLGVIFLAMLFLELLRPSGLAPSQPLRFVNLVESAPRRRRSIGGFGNRMPSLGPARGKGAGALVADFNQPHNLRQTWSSSADAP
jgi:hypothetical protein